MKLRYRYRIYPTDQQKRLMSQFFGGCRVVFNEALAYCQHPYPVDDKKPNSKELSKRQTEVKKKTEKQRLTEVSSVFLRQSLRDFEPADSHFFKSSKGQRKGQRIPPSKFKKYQSKQSARFTDNRFKLYLNSDSIHLDEIVDIKVVWSQGLAAIPSLAIVKELSIIKKTEKTLRVLVLLPISISSDTQPKSDCDSVILIKDSADRDFMSFIIEFTPQQLPHPQNSVQLDLRNTDFVKLRDDENLKSPYPLKKQLKRLRKLQRNLSRKQNGSKRGKVSRKKLIQLHAKISDTRNDFLHLCRGECQRLSL